MFLFLFLDLYEDTQAEDFCINVNLLPLFASNFCHYIWYL